jgi:hypothetical protein
LDASAVDGEVPALEMDLLVVAAAQQAAVLMTGLRAISAVEPVVDRLPAKVASTGCPRWDQSGLASNHVWTRFRTHVVWSWVAGDDCAEPVSGAVACGYESGLVVPRTGWRAA